MVGEKEMPNEQYQLLQQPVAVDIGEWVINNIGKVAAAQRLGNTTKAMIYAIEDSNSATPQMTKYAKENNAMLLVSISEDDQYYIG